MPNHRHNNEIIVVNGTAPLECLSQIKKLRKNPVLQIKLKIVKFINRSLLKNCWLIIAAI